MSFDEKSPYFHQKYSKYCFFSFVDYCGMDSSTLQGLSLISMASNNSLLPKAIFSPVPCASIWECSVVNEGECGPQQISTENRLNQSESADER